ncbi:hypothetical protein H920_19864 [Fukomys damarensis]|uniref:Uncharacterized protein n=1 Tax=Fukomys damarensis TaxID=885580 RepID=A0A091CMI4_FUKDA|nr:hypothetical protein H920_19864 [Fukomys damarensis]
MYQENAACEAAGVTAYFNMINSVTPPPALSLHTGGVLSMKLKSSQQDWCHAPCFLTPIKPHTVLWGQVCAMTYAFLGDPRLTATLYRVHHSQFQVLVQLHQPRVHHRHPHLRHPHLRNEGQGELGKDRPPQLLPEVYDEDDKTVLASITESLQKKSKHLM